MTTTISSRALPVVAIGLALVGCSIEDSQETEQQPSRFGSTVDAANAVALGDPLFEGQQHFLHDAYGAEQLDEWPPAEFMLGLMESEPEVFGDQYAGFGFIPDPSDEFPVGFKRGLVDANKMYETCALCHVGRLPDGRLWIGAPNDTLDWGRFRVAVNERWVAAGGEPLMSELQQEKALLPGPGRTNADSATFPTVVPADFPVYFDLDQRTALNYLGTGKKLRTEVFYSLYTFGADYPTAATAKIPFPPLETQQALIAFMGSLRAPTGPAQDPALVARGQAVFVEASCNSCHFPDNIAAEGIVTYVEDGPELLPGESDEHPRGTISTSGAHRTLQDGAIEDIERITTILTFNEEHGLAIGEDVGFSDGYRVNNLHGLWMSAPYLHNGSVENLEDLLKPASERPRQFTRHGFLVDTEATGNSNKGHEFGTDLSPEDKRALVAYLLTL